MTRAAHSGFNRFVCLYFISVNSKWTAWQRHLELLVFITTTSPSTDHMENTGDCISCTCSVESTPMYFMVTNHLLHKAMMQEQSLYSSNSSLSITWSFYKFWDCLEGGAVGHAGEWEWRDYDELLAFALLKATHIVGKRAYRQTKLGCQNVFSFCLCLSIESLWWAESLWTLSSSGRDERIEGLTASR